MDHEVVAGPGVELGLLSVGRATCMCAQCRACGRGEQARDGREIEAERPRTSRHATREIANYRPPRPVAACARAALARAPPHAPHHAERFIVRGFCREKLTSLETVWTRRGSRRLAHTARGATGWHPTVAASKPAVRDGTRFTSIMNRQPPRALYQSPLHAVTRSWSCQPLHMQKSAGSCQPWRRPQQCGYDQVQ